MDKKNKTALAALFVFTTVFFLWQHSTGLSWDFASYVLNARYLFDNGTYFEWLRPPLAPVILGFLSLFGWLAAEYLFIIAVAALHLFAALRLSKVLNLDPLVFYALTLTPFMVNMSFIGGTELLSFALLELCIASILAKDKKYGPALSGVFMGLSLLTRYTNLIFLPILLFNKNLKKMAASGIALLLTLSPWLIYNFVKTGNALTSLASSFLINITMRQSFNFFIFDDALFILSLLTITTILGMFYVKKDRAYWLMILFAVLSLFSFMRTSSETRYLFNLLLPAVYFSAAFFKIFWKNKWIKAAFLILVVINLSSALIFAQTLTDYSIYKNAEPYLDKECQYMANSWVTLNYLGYTTEAAPVDFNKHKIGMFIDEGRRLIYIKSIINADYEYANNRSFIEQFPVLNETSEYLVLGNEDGCKSPETFVERYSINNCKIFLPRFIQKFC